MKHIPNVVGDDPEDIAQWQESLRKLVPARGERPRIIGATIPTGLPSLDIALAGGWLRGRIVELENLGMSSEGCARVQIKFIKNPQ
jgi:hypothetical protein